MTRSPWWWIPSLYFGQGLPYVVRDSQLSICAATRMTLDNASITCGPNMARLHAALPESRRGAHATESTTLARAVVEALRPGDVLLVKGSLGSRMAYIVEALTEGFAPSDSRAVQ